MLVACRLAGLSALERHYAGVRTRAQFGPTRSAIAPPGTTISRDPGRAAFLLTYPGRRRGTLNSCGGEPTSTHQRGSPPSQRKGTKTQEFGLEKQTPPLVLSHIDGRVAADYAGGSRRPRRRARGAPQSRASHAADARTDRTRSKNPQS